LAMTKLVLCATKSFVAFEFVQLVGSGSGESGDVIHSCRVWQTSAEGVKVWVGSEVMAIYIHIVGRTEVREVVRSVMFIIVTLFAYQLLPGNIGDE
jgi:hypothetical protein